MRNAARHSPIFRKRKYVRITLLCSDLLHPVNQYLARWVESNKHKYEISFVRTSRGLPGGEILFLISCVEILSKADRAAYKSTLVLHASNLPSGRGWSPHIWEIIGGADQITVSLVEAEDDVDSGRLWHQITFPVPKDALWNEINSLLFDVEIRLIDLAVKEFEVISPVQQDQNIEPTYFPRRKPADSKIDPEISITSQFNRIRVCDPVRYPAYFELHGHRYKLILEKIIDTLDLN